MIHLELGGVLSEATFLAAALAGNEAALEWLVENGCPMGADGAPYVAAAALGDLATLRCLRWLGCRWGDTPGATFLACLRAGAPLAALRCLLAEGCPIDWEDDAMLATRRVYWLEPEADVAAWLAEEQRQRPRVRWQQQGGSGGSSRRQQLWQ